MRTTVLLATVIICLSAFAGCLHDNQNSTPSGNGGSTTSCWELLQTTTESSSDPGSYLYTNFTYDSDCRVIVSESMGNMYLNTTYDTDGNIATTETAITVDQGANWHYGTTTYLWGEP